MRVRAVRGSDGSSCVLPSSLLSTLFTARSACVQDGTAQFVKRDCLELLTSDRLQGYKSQACESARSSTGRRVLWHPPRPAVPDRLGERNRGLKNWNARTYLERPIRVQQQRHEQHDLDRHAQHQAVPQPLQTRCPFMRQRPNSRDGRDATGTGASVCKQICKAPPCGTRKTGKECL
jgi:hypothetical protein